MTLVGCISGNAAAPIAASLQSTVIFPSDPLSA
jgi:hypothetical protein